MFGHLSVLSIVLSGIGVGHCLFRGKRGKDLLPSGDPEEHIIDPRDVVEEVIRDVEANNELHVRTRTHKVLYVHVPKTAGESLIYASANASANVCTYGTHLPRDEFPFELCTCYSNCSEESDFAIIEPGPDRYFDSYKNQTLMAGWHKPVWVSLIREPEDWFYSAVGQWCAGGGEDTAPCQPEANLSTLLATGWFDKNASEPPVKYYFHGGNLQVRALGKIAKQPNYIVCAMPKRNVLIHMISALLAGHPDIKPDTEVNVVHWPDVDEFRERIPWRDVKQHFAKDQQLYDEIAKQGCVGSTSVDAVLKRAMLKLADVNEPTLPEYFW